MTPTTPSAIFALTVLSVACSYTPTVPSEFTAPATQVLKGTVYPTGITTFWLTTTQAGTLRMTLTGVEPGPIMLGLGLGGPNPQGTHCSLSVRNDVQAGSTPQITAPVEPGRYCVEVFDVGFVTLSGATFSVSVLFQ